MSFELFTMFIIIGEAMSAGIGIFTLWEGFGRIS